MICTYIIKTLVLGQRVYNEPVASCQISGLVREKQCTTLSHSLKPLLELFNKFSLLKLQKESHAKLNITFPGLK